MIWLLTALIAFQGAAPARRRPPSLEWRIAGHWEATVTEAKGKSRIVLAVVPTARRPFLLSAGENTPPRVPSGVSYSSHGDITATFLNPAAVLRLLMRPDGSALTGTWEREGTSVAVRFTRTAGPPEPPRPQTPRPPFPYESYNIGIDTGTGVLAGTMTMPKGAGPFPAVVLLSGTGPDDRDSTFAAHRPFLVIADYLTRRGFATLRYDDRGAGRSSGLFGELRTVEADAKDATAAVAFLQEEPGIDSKRIGFVGHSEGGLVAAVAARDGAKVAFLALLGSPAIDGVSLTLLQKDRIARAEGVPESEIAAVAALNTTIARVLRTETDTARAKADIRAAFLEAVRGGVLSLSVLATFERAMDLTLQRITSPQFRQRLFFEPAAALRALRVPVLALFGTRDVVVPAPENEPAMRQSLKGAPLPTEVRTFDGLNHLFQTARTGAISEQATIEETIAPAVLQALGAWLGRVAAK